MTMVGVDRIKCSNKYSLKVKMNAMRQINIILYDRIQIIYHLFKWNIIPTAYDLP